MITVVTTRFNKETLVSNYNYRQKHGFKCMYCCPSEISPKISYNTPVFVIEMNNSINKIEGIGLIKNKPETKKYYKVRSGDTLGQIASKNHTTISKICQLNGIKQSSSIQIGRSLRVK